MPGEFKLSFTRQPVVERQAQTSLITVVSWCDHNDFFLLPTTTYYLPPSALLPAPLDFFDLPLQPRHHSAAGDINGTDANA